MDHIRIGISGNEKLASILEKNKAEVCEILLCDELSNEVDENAKEWNINGENVIISVTKL
jgi:isoleucyl-tRNA synthetase